MLRVRSNRAGASLRLRIRSFGSTAVEIARATSPAISVAVAGALVGGLSALVDVARVVLGRGSRVELVYPAFFTGSAVFALLGGLLGLSYGTLVTATRAALIRSRARLLAGPLGLRIAVTGLLLLALQIPALTWLWNRPSLTKDAVKIATVVGVGVLALGLASTCSVVWERRGRAARRASALSFASGLGLLLLAHHPLLAPYPLLFGTALLLGVLAAADTLGAHLSRWLPLHRSAWGLALSIGIELMFARIALESVRVRHGLSTQTLAGRELLSAAQAAGLWRAGDFALENAVATKPSVNVSRLAAPEASVLVITIDSLRPDKLGAYGGPRGLTPNIDRFMQDAVVFDRAYAQFPATIGSLPSLLTGIFPWRPVSGWREVLLHHPTLPARLRKRGYRSAAFFGRMSTFDEDGALFSFDERRFGFDGGSSTIGGAHDRTRRALEFLRRTGRAVVWVHIMEPHVPYELHSELQNGPADPYENEIAYVDSVLAPLLEYASSQASLIVWLTADHGEAFGEHGQQYHSSSLYDEQIRVPLAVRVPGVGASRVPGPVELLDVLPTTLGLLGLEVHGLDGHDRRAEIEGGGSPSPAFAIFDDRVMVVDGTSKLICDTGSDSCELYDLSRDPAEHSNLFGLGRAEETRLELLLRSFVAKGRSFAKGERTTLRELLITRRAVTRGVRALADVATLLRSSDPRAREAGAKTLAMAPPIAQQARTDLTRMRHDDDAIAGFWAAIALARTGDFEAQKSLASLDTIAELGPESRGWLALARYEAGSPSALPTLRAALRQRSDIELARAMIETAERRGDLGVLAELEALLADPDLVEPAARALSRLAPEKSVAQLLAALDRQPAADTREALVRALGAAGQVAAIEPLYRLARQTAHPVLFAEAVLALHRLGRDPVDLAGVVSRFERVPGRDIHRARILVPHRSAGTVNCWVGVEGPSEALPPLSLAVNGVSIASEELAAHVLWFELQSSLLRAGENTIDLGFAGDPLPVRGVVVAGGPPGKNSTQRAELTKAHAHPGPASSRTAGEQQKPHEQ
jgi:hypothetical protein